MVLKNIKESILPFYHNLEQFHQLLEVELETSTHFFESGNSSDYRKLEKIKWQLYDVLGNLKDYL